MRVGHAISPAAATVTIWIVALTAMPFLLLFRFVVAARWLIWFCAGLLLMLYALGSVDYARWFWLAFITPMFVGGLVDGVFVLTTEARQRRDAGVV